MALTDKLTNIADAIRSKTDTTEKMTLDDMSSKIEGIQVGEDLSEELTTYNDELTEQETSITTIIEALNGKAYSPSNSNLNIYLQSNEPATKEGLWLQTSNTYDSVVIVEGENKPMSFVKTRANNTLYYMDESVVERVGNFIYVFGGYMSSGVGAHQYAFSYDLINNKWKQIANVPSYNGYSMGVTIGTDIYLFGFWGYYAMRKYNTQTNSYTTLAKPPQNTTGSLIVVVGDYIYMFGNDASTSQNLKASKYDIANNTWSSIATLPVNMTRGVVFAIGTDIYLLGGVSNSCYVYDTTKNTYTKINNSPSRFDRSPWYVDTKREKVYIFSPVIDNKSVYQYDYKTDTYEKLNATLPYTVTCSDSNVVEYNGTLLIVGGDGQTSSILDVNLNFLDVPSIEGQKSVLVYLNKDNQVGDYSFQLFNTSMLITDISKYNKFYFNDVAYISNNGSINNSIPIYYGNGTEWVKFKN